MHYSEIRKLAAIIYNYILDNKYSLLKINIFLFILFASKVSEVLSIWSIIILIFPLLYLFFIYRIYLKSYNSDRIIVLNQKKTIALFLFIFYIAISLTYSDNYYYGFEKYFGILIIIIPIVFTSTILLNDFNSESLKILSISMMVSGSLLTLIVLLGEPFTFNNELNIYGWSHVGYGKFMSFVFLICLFNMKNDSKNNLFVSIMFAFAITGLTVSGLRSAILSCFLITIIYFTIIIWNKNYSLKNIKQIFTSILLASILLLLFPKHLDSVYNRYAIMFVFKDLTFNDDPSIESRKLSYQIAFRMFQQSSIFGTGFGGFNNLFNGNELPQKLKYPHNMVLEIFSELGIIGAIIFLFMFISIAFFIYKINYLLILIFIHSLILSMFSGSLADQKQLFLFSSFLFIRPDLFNKLRNIFHNEI